MPRIEHIVFYNSLSLSDLQNTPNRPDITGQIQLLQQLCQFFAQTRFAIDPAGGDFVAGNEDGGREGPRGEGKDTKDGVEWSL